MILTTSQAMARVTHGVGVGDASATRRFGIASVRVSSVVWGGRSEEEMMLQTRQLVDGCGRQGFWKDGV